MKSVRAQIAGICLLLFAIGAAAQKPFSVDEEAEAQVLTALNLSRAEAGVPALKFDEKLRDAARLHSILLAQRNVLSHQFPGEPAVPDRLRSTGGFFSASAENVGLNSQADDINAMFMRSPGHRANMLNPAYNAVGIGVVRRGRDYWVTEDFAALTPTLSAQQAEDEAAASFEAKWKKARSSVPKRMSIETLRSFACETARSGGKLRKPGVTYEGRPPREIAGFSTPDPARLAPEVDAIITNGSVSAYAVGACTPQNSGDGGQFWIVMAFF